MPSLYTLRSAGEQYRITKLDHNLDVESSYLCSAIECQCPSFERRQRCRHLEMLPRFIQHSHIDDNYAHDFERNRWVQLDAEGGGLPTEVEAASFDEIVASIAAIPGVTLLNLDDLEKLHNTIAEAVGEPTLPPRPFQRRF